MPWHIRHPHHCRQLGTIIQGLADTIMVGRFQCTLIGRRRLRQQHHGVGVDFCLRLFLRHHSGHRSNARPGGIRKCRQGIESRTSSQRRTGHGTVPADGDALLFLGAHGTTRRASPRNPAVLHRRRASIPIQSLFNAFKQFFDSIGNTRTPMWIMISANLFNIVGNYLLIYGIGLSHNSDY